MINCNSCGQPLRQIPWNSACSLMVCVNWRCLEYKRPGAIILTGKKELIEQESEEEERKRREKEARYQAMRRAKKPST